MASFLERIGARDLVFSVANDVKDLAVSRLETEFDERVGSRLQSFVGGQATPTAQLVSETGREFATGGRATSVQDPRALAQSPTPSAVPTQQSAPSPSLLRPLLILGAVIAVVVFVFGKAKAKGKRRGRR